jgi:ring-1,2-phenylacetyl-CoA epoxidase subunit PaaC
LPKGDWAFTILRQFFFSNYQDLLYKKLQHSKDEQLAAIATKALKEVTYHLRWSSEWVIRLGDGTEESRNRISAALQALWPHTEEFFEMSSFERESVKQGFGVDLTTIRAEWNDRVSKIFEEATLEVPPAINSKTGGKEGRHTEHLDALLSELQYLQRTYPGCEW